MDAPRVEVDHAVCIGSGNCVEVAEGAFKLNEEGLAEPDDPSSVSTEQLEDAEEQCPVTAIMVQWRNSGGQ